MNIQPHNSNWFKKSEGNTSQPLQKVFHKEKEDVASSSHEEQIPRGMQKPRDRANQHHVLRGLATSSSATKQPPHKTYKDALINAQQNHAGKPSTPIIVRPPAHSGAQKKSSIASTNYARQAAELLIDHNGKLDRTHIAAMLGELQADGARPPEQKMLSDYHRKHVSNTLVALLKDDKLTNTINQICAHEPLRGATADLVRATLNIPPEQTSLSKVEARKAVVMSLLGNLRQQGEVASCFATMLAIALHREMPEIVASNLKELLENNSMTMKSGNANIQVPLNRCISRAETEIKLHVRSDGACFGKASSKPGESHWLHGTPGMAAALTALGIPKQHRQYYVSKALQKMNIQGNRLYDIRPRQIIEHLAHATDGKGLRSEQRITAALNAFSGAGNVRLLRAWEYTLATHGNSLTDREKVQKIGAAVLFPAVETNLEFLQSLSSRSEFQNAQVPQLNQELFSDVLDLMQQRFFMQYDPNIKKSGISGDGVSERGGHVLFDRVPPNVPSQWKRIDNPAMFQATMAHLAEEAARNTHRKAAQMGGDPEVNKQVLRYLTDNLMRHISNPDFTGKTSLRFNSCSGKGNVTDPFNLPWKHAGFGFPTAIMEHYGSTFLPGSKISSVNPPRTTGYGSTKIGKPDASSMLYSLLNAQISMGEALRNKARITKGEFYIPLANNGSEHVYSAIPTETVEIWQHPDPGMNLTPQQWVDKHLVQPAQAYVDKKRTTPQLYDLLQSIGDMIRMAPVQLKTVYRKISLKSEFRDGRQAYRLRDVHKVLSQECVSYPNAAKWKERMENALVRMVPQPPEMMKRIADLNWEDDEGNPIYMGIKHNPFTNKTEANFVDDKGKSGVYSRGNYLDEIGANWLFGEQQLGTPLNATAV